MQWASRIKPFSCRSLSVLIWITIFYSFCSFFVLILVSLPHSMNSIDNALVAFAWSKKYLGTANVLCTYKQTPPSPLSPL